MTFLTTKELAERWSTSTGYLANRRCNGKGPEYIKIGAKVLYPVDVIEAFEGENSALENATAG